MKVVIIGGGPAGLIAAISAAQENNEVIVYNQSFISKIIEKIRRIFKHK